MLPFKRDFDNRCIDKASEHNTYPQYKIPEKGYVQANISLLNVESYIIQSTGSDPYRVENNTSPRRTVRNTDYFWGVTVLFK
jgi:hypothetical protein